MSKFHSLFVEQKEYFDKKLPYMCQKYGTTGREKIVLDYIENEIENFAQDGVIFHRDDSFGIVIIVESKSKSKDCVLFDVCVDTLHEDYEDVFTFDDDIFGNNKPRKMVSATGLDPRVGVTVMLSMVKSIRLRNMSYAVLFSTSGKCEYEGSRRFSENIDFEKKFGFKVKRIVVVNVVEGIRNDEVSHHPYNVFLPVIGKGCLPFQQARTQEKEEELMEEYSFYSEEKSKFKNVPIEFLSICCSDKEESESVCSVSDAHDLMLWLSSPDFFETYLKIKEEKDEKNKKNKKQRLQALKKRFAERINMNIVKQRVKDEEVEGESDEDEGEEED